MALHHAVLLGVVYTDPFFMASGMAMVFIYFFLSQEEKTVINTPCLVSTFTWIDLVQLDWRAGFLDTVEILQGKERARPKRGEGKGNSLS